MVALVKQDEKYLEPFVFFKVFQVKREAARN